MITKDNLTACFDALTEDQITPVMESKGDAVAMYANGYGHIYLESFDYATDNEEDIYSTGGFIADKDDFLRLFVESGSNNKFLQPYI